MDYETEIALAIERIENKMFIGYLKDNIKGLQEAFGEIDEIAKEHCGLKRDAEDLGIIVRLFQP